MAWWAEITLSILLGSAALAAPVAPTADDKLAALAFTVGSGLFAVLPAWELSRRGLRLTGYAVGLACGAVGGLILASVMQFPLTNSQLAQHLILPVLGIVFARSTTLPTRNNAGQRIAELPATRTGSVPRVSAPHSPWERPPSP